PFRWGEPNRPGCARGAAAGTSTRSRARSSAKSESPAAFSSASLRRVSNVIPVSVVIVARNEAQNLPRCLESVRGWVAESIVVLNNTTDDSEAVAVRHGALVFETEWRGYRDTKNWALAQAKQPWALCLDADEEVSPALKADLQNFFA